MAGVARDFDHGSDPVVRVIAGPTPETYDAAWQEWLKRLEADEPTTPDVPAAVELGQARELGEV